MKEDGLGLVELGDGCWGFRFRPVDREHARAYIDAKRQRGEELAYERVKGESRPRPRSKGRRQAEAEQIAAHAPLVGAIGAALKGEQPQAVPPIPPTPPGFDAITGQRIDPARAVRTPSGETLGIRGQVLAELLRGHNQQAARQPGKPPAATPPPAPAGKPLVAELLDRWKTGRH